MGCLYDKFVCLGIGLIGRTWRQVREYCFFTDEYPTNLEYGGDFYQNTNYYQRVVSPYYQPCSGGLTQLQDLGGHDFQTVINKWQPRVDHVEGHP